LIPLRRFAAAWSFLTPVPLGIHYEREDFERCLGWFPVVGLALGALLAALGTILASALPSTVAAAGVVAAYAILTGGLHLDGLADVFDGIGCRGDRERTLEVMRDSRVGAHGVVALVCGLLLRFAAVAALLEAGHAAAIVLGAVVGRAVVVGAIVRWPYARARGLGTTFKEFARGDDLAWAFGIATVAAVAIGGPMALIAALLGVAAARTLAARVMDRVGGLTGDAYGALVEVSDVVVLGLLAGLL